MRAEFTTVRVVGPMLPPDLLSRVIAGDKDLAGLTGKDYHLASGETPREAANRAWSYLSGVWKTFRAAVDDLPETDPAVGLTREKWLLILMRELGYGRVPATPAGGILVEDRAFAVSHLWERAPIHLLGWNVPLDKRTKGVSGAAERAPHPMLQECLNRADEYLWALLSNGRVLRILRDSTSLAGVSYIEFDLEAMFDGEVFSDFVLLYLMAHQSRVELLAPDAPPTDCWLEKWRTASIASGTRALGLLRDGVAEAITALGTGFVQHPANAELRRRLEAPRSEEGALDLADYHRSLLRLVYRLLFLFVAEDRDALLHGEDTVARERYATYFSTGRLRRLALRRRGTAHGDLWQGLSVVLDALGRDEGRPELALPGLGGLFDHGPLDVVTEFVLPNDALLAAVRHLSVVQPKGQAKRTVDYRNLGAEELGSIYESLLELVPRYDRDARTFALENLAGNDRKTSGSYYTPTSLIDLVLDEALDPLLDDAEKTSIADGGPEAALLALTVCDPACGSGHFLVAAARRIAARLARVRTQDLDPGPTDLQTAMHDVVERCIYGVDLNPTAAELARVSLWLEALEPGRPLSFLDAHIKVGNALLGATPSLLAAGIPDAAYKPIEGDDKKVAATLRKRNRTEVDARVGQQGVMFADVDIDVSNTALRRTLADIEHTPTHSLADAHIVRSRFLAFESSPERLRALRLADTWCAAFVQLKTFAGQHITDQALTAVARPLCQPGLRHPPPENH
ncbi:MAG: N-6 DNA methylase [Sporichthyaceae bacterium]